MDEINRLILDPRYQEILAILKGARNGLVYGAKIRFPHALVMSLIFHGGRPWKDRVRFVYKATKQHALNLSRFNMIYKTSLLFLRYLGGKEHKMDTFLAGLMGGYFVFGEQNSVNEQIVLYCVSRVISSFLPRAQSSKLSPPTKPNIIVTQTTQPNSSRTWDSPPGSMPHPPGYPYSPSIPIDRRVFSVYAAITWGAVMWLFRWRRHTLQGGLVNSMQYLYLDSEVWSNLKNLLWHNIA
ncbi:peroxisomal membrane protein PMP 24 [Melampsora americana]|nr:peroxisomal membrane protein PMP 24 [Melampsora americana]